VSIAIIAGRQNGSIKSSITPNYYRRKPEGEDSMNKPAGFDEAETYGEFKTIAPGGHICVIKKAEVTLSQSGREMMVVYFDVAEGESAGFYMEQYNQKVKNNPNYTYKGVYRQLTTGNSLPFFKGMLADIEKSNPGYTWNWDEKTLKGKLFGGVFGQEEYKGQDGTVKLSTKIRFIRSVDDIRKGVEVPKIKT
jgi:hypothetical protein